MDTPDAATIQTIHQYVVQEWRSVRAKHWAQQSDEPRPVGVWICQYGPQPSDVSHIRMPPYEPPPLATWFLDERGIQPMNPASFVRFWLVKVQRTWASGEWNYPDDGDFGRPLHRIAWANFAPYEGSDDLYLEVIWGGLWAHGERVAMRDGELATVNMLWIS